MSTFVPLTIVAAAALACVPQVVRAQTKVPRDTVAVPLLDTLTRRLDVRVTDPTSPDDGPPLVAGRTPDMPTEHTARRLRVVSTTEPVVIDGHLSEAAWGAAPVTGAWRQVIPEQSVLAAARTEVRVLQDSSGLYFGIRAYRAPSGAPPRNRDLRRDFTYSEHDVVSVILDPFRDQRGVWLFGVAATGNLADYTYTMGAGSDQEWDAPWRARTVVTDSGWTAEMAIPWHALPFPAGDSTWGVNFARGERSTNETSMWSPVPRGNGLMRPNFLGRLDGVRPPDGEAPVRWQPFWLGRGSKSAFGLDVKWRPTRSTVMDLTVNTDFAQADVDRQVVNLSRFSVLFPERRPFFQEGRLLFTTGIDDRIQPFNTRRIGLDDAGMEVPIVAGSRVVRRTPAGNSALLLMRQERSGSYASSDFAVARSTRNLGDRTRVGLLALGRFDAASNTAASPQAVGSNASASDPTDRQHATAGVDAYVQLSPIASIEASVSGTWVSDTFPLTDAPSTGIAGHVRASYAGSRLWNSLSLETARNGYQPLVGFLGRRDYTQFAWAGELDARPAWRPAWMRRALPSYQIAAVWSASRGTLEEARVRLSPFALERQDGARTSLGLEVERQVLVRPFVVLPGVSVPVGQTDVARVVFGAHSDPSRALVARVDANAGGYFDGHAISATTQLSWAPTPRTSFSMRHTTVRLNDVGGVGALSTHLLAPEFRLAWSPRLQLTGFYQHDTGARQGSMNMRASWELAPLSFLHVVWNDRRPVAGLVDAPAGQRSRELVVKLSYLFAR